MRVGGSSPPPATNFAPGALTMMGRGLYFVVFPRQVRAMADPHGHTHHQTDVIIVGAGPVGLVTVFECGMVRLSCHVVDVLADAGRPVHRALSEKPIYDVPGFPDIEAAELVVRLKAQAAPFRPVYHLGEQVQALGAGGAGRLWRAPPSKGTVLQAKP